MAVAQSSSGIVAIRYVLPFFWMTSCFSSTMDRMAYSCMNVATKDQFRLNLLIYRNVGHNSISYY